MDKNTITGMLLMGAVIFGFMWLNQPSQEEIARQREAQRVEAEAAKAKATEALTTANVDSLADNEVAALKQTIRAYGSLLGDTVGEKTYNLKNATADLVLRGDKLSGFLTIAGGGVVDVAEALKKDSDNPVLHNRAVAALKSAALDFVRNGNFARYMAGTDTTVSLQNDLLKVDIASRGGAIVKATLKQYTAYNADQVELFDASTNSYSFVLNTNSQRFDTRDFYFTPVVLNDSTVLMQLDLGGGSKWGIKYTLRPDHYDVQMDVLQENMDRIIPTNITNMDFAWSQKMSRHEAGKMFEERNSAIYFKYAGGDVEYLSESSNKDKEMTDRLKWISFKNQFFSSVLIARGSFNGANMHSEVIEKNSPDYENFLKNMEVTSSLDYNSTNANPASFNFFFGPNRYPLLSDYDDMIETDEDLELTKLIPLGWPIFRWINTCIIIPIFDFLGGFIPNYGLVILIMTLIIKLALWPLMHKTYMSQAKMRFLAPDIKAINEKYPGRDNAMTRQQKTMALYSLAGASPFSGCLPMLLQMPFLFAVFSFFPSCIDLRGESFLWVHDLSAPDAIFSWDVHIPFITNYFGNHISLFCLLMTVTNIMYTRITMQSQASNDSMPGMKWMMYLMPIMFLVFFNNYAAGLSYYYFLSLLFTIMQNYGYRRLVSEEKMRAQMAENAKKPKKKSCFMARMEEMQRQQRAMLEEQNRRKNNGKGRQ